MIFLLSKGHLKVLKVLVFSGGYSNLQTDRNILLGASPAKFEGVLHGITFISFVADTFVRDVVVAKSWTFLSH